MKLPAFITKCLGLLGDPVSEIVYVEPNDRGGFGLREADGSHAFGNYPTAEDARRVVLRSGLTPVLRLEPPAAPEATPRGAMKYVIMRERSGVERPMFCLPPSTHFELAQLLTRSTGGEVISAGFVAFKTDGTAETFGESTTLKLSPRDSDARFITAYYRATIVTNPYPQLQPA